MDYTEIMVRYGELSTKGHNKKNFIDRLGTNVRKALHRFEQVKVHAQRDRLRMRRCHHPVPSPADRHP